MKGNFTMAKVINRVHKAISQVQVSNTYQIKVSTRANFMKTKKMDEGQQSMHQVIFMKGSGLPDVIMETVNFITQSPIKYMKETLKMEVLMALGYLKQQSTKFIREILLLALSKGLVSNSSKTAINIKDTIIKESSTVKAHIHGQTEIFTQDNLLWE